MYSYELRRDGELVLEFEADGDTAAMRRAAREGYVVIAVESPFGLTDATVLEVAA